MIIMRTTLYLLFALILAIPLAGQKTELDSLKFLLNDVQGQSRVNLLNTITSKVFYSDAEAARVYAQESFDLSKEIRYQQGLISSAYALSILERDRGKILRAARVVEEGISTAASIGNQQLQLRGLEILTSIYQAGKRNSKFEEAKIRYDKLKDDIELARMTNEISTLNDEVQSQTEVLTQVEAKAQEFNQVNQELSEELKETRQAKILSEAELAIAEKDKAVLQSEVYKKELIASEQQRALLEKDTKLKNQQFLLSLLGVGLIAFVVVTLLLVRYNQLKRLRAQEKLETQRQLLVREKLATLGQITAGIAHEIKNPLNFVNNFAEGSTEIVLELEEVIQENQKILPSDQYELATELVTEIKQNALDILDNGKRADRIVHSMMEHARDKSGDPTNVEVNQLIDDSVKLAYHGFLNNNEDFNVDIQYIYDDTLPIIQAIPQDISRVVINLVNNACYAMREKQLKGLEDYQPTLIITTNQIEDYVEITLRDNGTGIPDDIRQKIFDPFFTTKPTGDGNAGLGLSISFEIIVQRHQGKLKVESELNEFSEFEIQLPIG
ncbi:MAG: ATP-binding protein, partial [Bacteroidota bacterium]